MPYWVKVVPCDRTTHKKDDWMLCFSLCRHVFTWLESELCFSGLRCNLNRKKVRQTLLLILLVAHVDDFVHLCFLGESCLFGLQFVFRKLLSIYVCTTWGQIRVSDCFSSWYCLSFYSIRHCASLLLLVLLVDCDLWFCQSWASSLLQCFIFFLP